MPYIKKEIREKLRQGIKPATVGDLNYLYSLIIYSEWKKNESYTTIHKLRTSVEKPHTFDPIWELTKRFKFSGWLDSDLQTARELAFNEFYRRFASKYEDSKMLENGDFVDDIYLAEIINGHNK